MKVSALQLYLRSLLAALTATDTHSSAPAEVESACAGLQPFANLDLSQLASVLRQAEEYRSSGVISAPPAVGPEAAKLDAALRSAAVLAEGVSGAVVLDAGHINTERDRLRRELEQALAAFLKPLAIGVTLKGDSKGFEASVLAHRTRALAARVREALAGVTDEVALNAPERQQQLADIVAPLPLAELKAVAIELGTPRSSTTKEGLLPLIVAHLTGIKSSAKPARGTKAVDQAAVKDHAVKLKELLERSIDPDALSESDIEAALGDLKGKSVPEIRAIAQEAGLENVGKTKTAILDKVRLKLTEARRARDPIQV